METISLEKLLDRLKSLNNKKLHGLVSRLWAKIKDNDSLKIDVVAFDSEYSFCIEIYASYSEYIIQPTQRGNLHCNGFLIDSKLKVTSLVSLIQ